MANKTEKKHKEKWIYVGRRVGGKKNTELRFAYVQEEYFDGKAFVGEHTMLYLKGLESRSKRHGDIIGALYEVEVGDGENRTVYGGAKWLAMHQAVADDVLVQWRVWDDEALATVDQAKAQKKAKANDPVLACLDPIRDAYRNTNAQGRRALLAKVLVHITGGR